ncbi:MAG: hypothetical protein L6Q71_05220, partial [Planctomycetes bacterium]|nr:hypothetical protein [Planctomycetota bacterium]
MARQDQYEQEYDDQAYEEVEEFYEDEGGDADSGVDYSEADVVRSMPWMAIAIAVHAIFLLIAMVIYTATIEEPKVEILKTELAEDFVMPIPEEQDPPEVEVPKPEDPVEDPTKDPKITEEAVDESNEDPTDNPNNQMAENPNADNTKAESPNPNSGPSSAFGTGGGGGGGGGMGGGGGAALRRARGGGGKENQKQVEAGLQWLADHQNEQTGSWSATNFMDSSIRTKKGAATTGILEFERVGEPGVGWANTVDVGLSGLALLAFVGDGHTHRGGKFKENVRRGLNYMLSVQDAEGCFGVRDGEEWIYNHAICAMAVIEIYIISQDRMLKSPAQRSVDFIVNAQNPGWGWRYDIKPGVNDSSVTAWMVLALKSAKMAELEFPAEQINVGANAWYDKVTVDEGYGPVTGYNSPGSLNGRLNESDHENNPS